MRFLKGRQWRLLRRTRRREILTRQGQMTASSVSPLSSLIRVFVTLSPAPPPTLHPAATTTDARDTPDNERIVSCLARVFRGQWLMIFRRATRTGATVLPNDRVRRNVWKFRRTDAPKCTRARHVDASVGRLIGVGRGIATTNVTESRSIATVSSFPTSVPERSVSR